MKIVTKRKEIENFNYHLTLDDRKIIKKILKDVYQVLGEGGSYCNKNISDVELSFLKENYLQSKYHVSYEIERAINLVDKKLNLKFGESFVSICVVGGLVNGSYVIRKEKLRKRGKSFLSNLLRGKTVATDLDFYLIVNAAGVDEISEMAGVIAQNFGEIGIVVDATLNGKNKEQALDVSQLDFYIRNNFFDMLSLPFKYCSGEKVAFYQKEIKNKIKKMPGYQANWDELKFYHDSTLGLYHGSFDIDFVRYVEEKWLSKKLEKYGLGEL